MGFRTVVVNSRSKLECRLNFLIVRGETEKRIYINEINTLIVQSTAVSLTAALLSELVRNNVKVVFCDEKCNPSSELLPYYGSHNTSKRIKIQTGWTQEIKDEVWKVLIAKKITSQSELLKKRGFETESIMLEEYAADVTPGDKTNREGHSAKVYFNCILPEGVTRRGGGFINGCLNYGYAVLLSAINREIVASGYMTQIGVWHDNEFNEFNLGSDMIEDTLKVCGVKPSKNYDTLIEKLVCYINIFIELKSVSFFVLVGFRDVLSDEDLIALIDHCKLNKVGLFFLESGKCRKRLQEERKIIITEDLCEIVENIA